MTHRAVSFWKSNLRIIGYGVSVRSILIGALILAIAEVLGVIEELVEA